MFWQTANSIPVKLMSDAESFDAFTEGYTFHINNNGLIVGVIENSDHYPNKGFVWDGVNKKSNFFLDPGLSMNIHYYASAINNHPAPQIVGGNNISAILHPFIYDTGTAILQDIGTPGETGFARDINSDGDVVGSVYSVGGVIAVLWTLNGLVRADLNNPIISNATSMGWNLVDAGSINNKGYITGSGKLIGGDVNGRLPWLLTPLVRIVQVPVEYMLPRILWPGDWYKVLKPKWWPLKIPFPFPGPDPSPFQLVGTAFNHLANILGSKNIYDIANTMTNISVRKEIQKIIQTVIREETIKLKRTLGVHSAANNKNKK